MAVPKKKKAGIMLDAATLARLANEYDTLRVKKTQYDKRMKEIADVLKSYAQNHGVQDDAGSFYVDVDGYTFGAQCRKSVKFNADAAKKLMSMGFDDCVTMVPEIDEESVKSHVDDGSITLATLEEITTVSESFAITVKATEEMPEVQQTEVAASRKKPLLGRKE